MRTITLFFLLLFATQIVFAQEETEEKKQKEIPTPKWSKVRRQLANDVIADIPRIGKLPLHTVLSDLSERIKKSA